MTRTLNTDGTIAEVIRTVSDTDKREEYFRLLELHNRNRIDYNDRKWETIKFGQTIVGAIYVAMIALTLTAANLSLLQHGWIRLVFAMLFLMGTFTCGITVWNLWRESRLLFLEEGTIFKIAHLLNLDITLAGKKQWIQGDEHLFSEKWRRPSYGIDKQMDKGLNRSGPEVAELPSAPDNTSSATGTPTTNREEEESCPQTIEKWADMKTSQHFYWRWYGFLFALFGAIGIFAAVVVLVRGASWDQPRKNEMAGQEVQFYEVDAFDELDTSVRRFVIPDQDGSGIEVYVSFSHPEGGAPVVHVFVDSDREEGQLPPDGTKSNANPKKDNL